MKLLLILASEKNYEILSTYIKPLGFDLIRYKHVLKAMDNIDEIDPTGIIISASDFPRHWKTLVQFVRTERPKDTTPIIVLRGENFLLEETTKAFYLGVSGVVSENLSEPMEIDRLQSILSRYVSTEEKRKAKRYKLEKNNQIAFMFTHPENDNIITGKIIDISQTGISFDPDDNSLLEDISLETEFPNCSLRIGSDIISPICKLVKLGKTIAITFTVFADYEQNILNDYLERIPLMNRG
jgi:hypothetical protein